MDKIRINEIIENIIFLTGNIDLYFEFCIKNNKSKKFNNERFLNLLKNINTKDLIDIFINYEKNKEILLWLNYKNMINSLNLTFYEKTIIINYGDINTIKLLYENNLFSNSELNLIYFLYPDLNIQPENYY